MGIKQGEDENKDDSHDGPDERAANVAAVVEDFWDALSQTGVQITSSLEALL
jgi:hypothetical protein